MDSQELDGDMLSHHEATVNPQAQDKKTTPFLTLNVFPGFKCFFRRNTQEQKISYHECCERVMKSHFQLSKIRMPFQSILQNKSLNLAQKSRLIYTRTAPEERNYIQSEGGDIVKYRLGNDNQKMIEELKQQLDLYRRSAQEALVQKRQQFKKKREEQEKQRMRVEEQNNRRARVIQKLNQQYALKEFKRKIDTNVNISL